MSCVMYTAVWMSWCDVYSGVDVLCEMYMVRACYRGGCTWCVDVLCGCR